MNEKLNELYKDLRMTAAEPETLVRTKCLNMLGEKIDEIESVMKVKFSKRLTSEILDKNDVWTKIDMKCYRLDGDCVSVLLKYIATRDKWVARSGKSSLDEIETVGDLEAALNFLKVRNNIISV